MVSKRNLNSNFPEVQRRGSSLYLAGNVKHNERGIYTVLGLLRTYWKHNTETGIYSSIGLLVICNAWAFAAYRVPVVIPAMWGCQILYLEIAMIKRNYKNSNARCTRNLFHTWFCGFVCIIGIEPRPILLWCENLLFCMWVISSCASQLVMCFYQEMVRHATLTPIALPSWEETVTRPMAWSYRCFEYGKFELWT